MLFHKSLRFGKAVFMLLALPMAGGVSGQNSPAAPPNGQSGSLWEPPVSPSRISHFETLNGRRVWFVNGSPFTALGAETEWNRIVYPHYQETMDVYDYTYPAAAAMHMNTLKVPVKWSQVEPAEGQFDFSYVDHIRQMAQRYRLAIVLDWFGHYASAEGTLYSDKQGEMYAPLWVIDDPVRFPRAVDAVGNVHQDAASYASPAIVKVESAAFAATLRHIRTIDSTTNTIIGIQVENEVSVFGGKNRNNPVYWRDYSQASEVLYRSHNFTNDLSYTAWEYSTKWLSPLMEAGSAADSLPFFMNFVGGELESWNIGGSPGEDVSTYLENIPPLTFIGLNNYVEDSDRYSADQFRAAINRYRVGRNTPAITETNSGPDPVTERSLFLAVGESGSPLFTPWSLVISYPQRNKPYVVADGKLANGAFDLSAAYDLLNRALPAISYWGGTPHATVFMSDLPGAPFSRTASMEPMSVTVAGSDNGQAIVLQPSDNELILIGYRCQVTLQSSSPSWSARNAMNIQSGAWHEGNWETTGAPVVVTAVDSKSGSTRIYLPDPQVVRVSW